MRIITTFLTLLVLIFGQIPLLQAQNRSYNYFEPGYQLTPLLGSTANFFEFEAGRQLKSGFSFGAVSHWMVSDIRRTSVNGDEFLSSLWYAGPRLQYHSAIRDRFLLYGGSTFGFGTTNYREHEFDLTTEGGVMISTRPEFGIQYIPEFDS